MQLNKKIINSAILGSALTVTTINAAKKPNVVIILTDDQGYGDLSCHGNPSIKTPALDKLHSESIRFTNFHVSPTCAPTRGALMTGRYPNAIGTWHTINGRNMMWKDEKTLADYFSGNGYKTAIFGKWHLGDNPPHRPQDRGFQHVLIHGGGGIGQAPDHWDNDYFGDTYQENGMPKKFKGYSTDIWFSEAEKFIEKNKANPFLVYISTNAPHSPFNVPKKYADLFTGLPASQAKFYGMITNLDENIGKFRDFLTREKLTDNTILIFMTDNGTAKGFKAGMRGKKGSPYEGGHRVPFFIYWPKGNLKGGKDIKALCAHIDLLPTLAELCHLQIGNGKEIHGKSLVPLLTGQAANWPKRTIITDSQRVHIPEKWRNSVVMTPKWRLVNGKELYDIEKDPGQKHNIATKSPKVIKKLRNDYETWWEKMTSENKDKIAAISIGTHENNPVKLSSHDWYMPKNNNSVWNQNQVRKGVLRNGFWIVDVKTHGEYEISLCRWPKEAGTAITAPLPAAQFSQDANQSVKGQALKITKAKMSIGGITKTATVSPGEKSVSFQIKLKPGRKRLQTWFYSNDAPEGKIFERGAYYVYITKL